MQPTTDGVSRTESVHRLKRIILATQQAIRYRHRPRPRETTPFGVGATAPPPAPPVFGEPCRYGLWPHADQTGNTRKCRSGKKSPEFGSRNDAQEDAEAPPHPIPAKPRNRIAALRRESEHGGDAAEPIQTHQYTAVRLLVVSPIAGHQANDSLRQEIFIGTDGRTRRRPRKRPQHGARVHLGFGSILLKQRLRARHLSSARHYESHREHRSTGASIRRTTLFERFAAGEAT